MTTKTIPTLREIFDLAQKNSKRVFLEDGELVPIWHGVPEDPSAAQLLICSPWNGDDEKYQAIETIRDVFKQHRVVRYVFVVEAWAVTGKDPSIMRCRPSENPDRREILRIQAEDRDGSVLSGMYYILRPEHGPATLSPFHEDPSDMLQAGRMMGMLSSDTRH
jgi:hypothetical protein